MRLAPAASDLTRYATDTIGFIDACITRNELGQPFRLLDTQREILRLAFVFDTSGRLEWETFVYSCLKKDGKTTTNALLTTWWAWTQEAPKECYSLANDLEQSQSRVFAAISKLIRNNAALASSAVSMGAQRIVLTNGTEIRALASEYAGSAGSNHGLTSWDELWAYTSEASRRLWEELTPVSTRRNSIRIISTYAGFEGESQLLWDLYKQGVGPEEHPEGQGKRIHPTLPVYINREARQLTYWDHEARAPWSTAAYRATQKRTLRPNSYIRLHENRWSTSESTFLLPELWDGCVYERHAPCLFSDKALAVVAGIDAAVKGDTAAVVAVSRDDDRIALVRHHIWQPSAAEPLDLEATIEEFLHKLHRDFRLTKAYADPYQMHRSLVTLKAAGVAVEEFPQTVANTVRMGQTLFELLRSQHLILYPDALMRQQALSTVAIESPRGFRISKEKASRKIDSIVALAMACCAALDAPVRAPFRIL